MSQLHIPCIALPLLQSHVCVSGQAMLLVCILRCHIPVLHTALGCMRRVASVTGPLVPEGKSDVFGFIIQCSQCIRASTPVIASHRPSYLYVVWMPQGHAHMYAFRGETPSQGDPLAGGWMSRQSCQTQCRGTCSRRQGRPACKPCCSSTWRQASTIWAFFSKWSRGP